MKDKNLLPNIFILILAGEFLTDGCSILWCAEFIVANYKEPLEFLKIICTPHLAVSTMWFWGQQPKLVNYLTIINSIDSRMDWIRNDFTFHLCYALHHFRIDQWGSQNWQNHFYKLFFDPGLTTLKCSVAIAGWNSTIFSKLPAMSFTKAKSYDTTKATALPPTKSTTSFQCHVATQWA